MWTQCRSYLEHLLPSKWNILRSSSDVAPKALFKVSNQCDIHSYLVAAVDYLCRVTGQRHHAFLSFIIKCSASITDSQLPSPYITLSLNTAVAVAEYGWTHDASKAVLLPRVVAVVSNGAGSGGVGAQVRQLVGILSNLEK